MKVKNYLYKNIKGIKIILICETKKIWICRQLKYHQLGVSSGNYISLEIILNAFNV